MIELRFIRGSFKFTFEERKQLDEAVWEYSKDEEWRVVHMKYEADTADLLRRGRTEGRAVGRAEGRNDERLLIRKVFELTRAGKSIEYIAAEINMPENYVEETLDMAFMK